jgi:translation elongation factor EF-Ts
MSFLRTFSTQPSLLEVVSKLRNQTSLSLTMCRKAAIESNYDFQSALNLLLKSSATSLNSNFKATSRGKDGIIGIMGYLNRKCLIEVNFLKPIH